MTKTQHRFVKISLGLLFGLIVIGLTGCQLLWADGTSGGTIVQSDLPRETDPDVSTEDVGDVASGNTAFAFELFHEIVEGDKNLFFSPYSISSALAMAYAGARGTTEAEMETTLHFGLGQAVVHPAFNRLDLELNSRGDLPPPYEGEGFQLNVVNAVWGQQDHVFLSDYLDTLAVNYGAGLRLLDFLRDPDGSRLTINDWVSDQTNERIQDLLPQNSITPDTVFVLTNAIYFNAPWLNPFEQERTEIGSFTGLDDTTVETPMMHQQTRFGYAEWANGRAVELLYNGAELSMVVLLPDAGQFQTFVEGLNASQYEAIVASLTMREVDLRFPKFEFDYDVSLADPLAALGMPTAFQPLAADFSGIDGTKDLLISDVLHKAFVSVDEEGTEAAAATAIVFVGTGMPEPPVIVNVDCPFLFVIRDIPTGSILFIGQVVQPSEG